MRIECIRSNICRDMKSYKLWIEGKVQGVWYRASAKKQAEILDVMGFIENEPDGSVYAEAEGQSDQVKLFIDWCKIGSQFASVTSVKIEEQDVQGFIGFDVKR